MGLMNALSRRFWYQHTRGRGHYRLRQAACRIADGRCNRKGEGAATASDQLIDYIEDFARKTLDT